MRDYAILVREREGRAPDIQTVPYGFSWGAFFFQVLWALYRAVWLTALGLLVVVLVVPWLGELARLDPPAQVVLEIATALVIGLAANDLRRWELARRGYRLVDIVTARGVAEAEESGIRGYVDGKVEAIQNSRAQGLRSPAEQAI